jgi:hypothetical protein
VASAEEVNVDGVAVERVRAQCGSVNIVMPFYFAKSPLRPTQAQVARYYRATLGPQLLAKRSPPAVGEATTGTTAQIWLIETFGSSTRPALREDHPQGCYFFKSEWS